MPTTPPPDPDARSDQAWAQRLHDHTHEVELLISAALIFGLFQLPGALDGWFDGLSPRLADEAWMVAFVGWYYTKLIVYTLVLAFGLHVVARAYWVGLVGLDSVFPEGVDWDRMQYGPWTRRTYRARVRPLSSMARAADRFASAIFGLAFLVVCLFVLSVVLAAAVGLVALGLSRLLPWDTGPVWLALMVLSGSGPVLATTVDRLWGGRISEGSLLQRAIHRTLDVFYLSTGGALFLPIQFVLFTRVAKKVIWPLYVGLFVVLIGVFLGGELARSGSFTLASSDLLPARPGARSVDARYFAATRDPGSTAPFVQAEVVTGPFVRLELPLVARRDAERMAERCGDETPLGGTGLVRSSVRDAPADAEAADRVLACIGGLWTVVLDGAPLEPAWDFRSGPGSGVTALVAFLPTRDLAPGPHVLEIAEVPVDEGGAAGEADADDEPEIRRHLIRFRSGSVASPPSPPTR